ncbi:hypothetical protein KUW11_18470 [Maritimibacter alkaliphilus]|nr:hypothetical protein [Maritimibacter alkaliphilus]
MDGKPWFPAKDVCDVLGLTDQSNIVRRLRASEVKPVRMSEVSNPHSTRISFPNRGMTCISETGVYKMIMLSRKPNAEAFQDWVAEAVLPAIRKDGMYVRDEEKVETEEDLMAMSLRVMEGLREKLNAKTEELGIMSERVGDVSRNVAHVAGQMRGVNRNAIKADLMREGFLHRQYGQY